MKKILKLAVPFILIIAAFASYYVSADSKLMYSDIAGHWAVTQIEKWSRMGVISGGEGKFRPDDGLTLAEFATILTRVMPLEGAAKNTFTDVSDDDWYAEAVLKCVAAGIIDVEGKTELEPKQPLTRTQAFMMLARAFDIAPVYDDQLLKGYNDAKRLTEEEKPYFEAMLELDLISGGNAVQLYPQDDITRAEVVDALDRLQNAGYIE